MSKGAVAMSGPKRCIDGSITTACIAGGHDHSWLSLQLAPGTRVGAVTVVGSRTTWAGSNHGKFAVWVGDKEAARQPPAVQCGKRLHLSKHDSPFHLVQCEATGEYVTLVHHSPSFLFVAEVQVRTMVGSSLPAAVLGSAPSPPAPHREVARDIIERFSRGKPSDQLHEAGVLVTIFDDWGERGKPWVRWWHSTHVQDHVSTSLINRRMHRTFGHSASNAGIVIAPNPQILCAWIADAGTVNKANLGCGSRHCTAEHKRGCSWKAENFKDMMEDQLSGWVSYNEVLISTLYWHDVLPEIIDGFLFFAGSKASEKSARRARSAFLKEFSVPASRCPLMRYFRAYDHDVCGMEADNVHKCGFEKVE